MVAPGGNSRTLLLAPGLTPMRRRRTSRNIARRATGATCPSRRRFRSVSHRRQTLHPGRGAGLAVSAPVGSDADQPPWVLGLQGAAAPTQRSAADPGMTGVDPGPRDEGPRCKRFGLRGAHCEVSGPPTPSSANRRCPMVSGRPGLRHPFARTALDRSRCSRTCRERAAGSRGTGPRYDPPDPRTRRRPLADATTPHRSRRTASIPTSSQSSSPASPTSCTSYLLLKDIKKALQASESGGGHDERGTTGGS